MNLARIVALKRLCFSLLFAASMFGDARGQTFEKVRDAKVTKLIVETTIFELTEDGKVIVKVFQSAIERGTINKYKIYGGYGHNDRQLGMKIDYVWMKTAPYYNYEQEKQPEDVDALVITVHAEVPVLYSDNVEQDAKSYIMRKMQYLYFQSRGTIIYNRNLVGSKTIPLNQAGFQHSILGPLRVLSLKAEKIYGVYELHIKIRQVFKSL